MPRAVLSMLSFLSSLITSRLRVLTSLSNLSTSHALVSASQGFLRSRLAALNTYQLRFFKAIRISYIL